MVLISPLVHGLRYKLGTVVAPDIFGGAAYRFDVIKLIHHVISLDPRSTAIPGHSRLNMSTTVSTRKRPPLKKLSDAKSMLQQSLMLRASSLATLRFSLGRFLDRFLPRFKPSSQYNYIRYTCLWFTPHPSPCKRTCIRL
jgi:hypothetical protein